MKKKKILQEKVHRKLVSILGKDYHVMFGLGQGSTKRTCFLERMDNFLRFRPVLSNRFQFCLSWKRRHLLTQGGFGYKLCEWGPEYLDRVHGTGCQELAGHTEGEDPRVYTQLERVLILGAWNWKETITVLSSFGSPRSRVWNKDWNASSLFGRWS